jgi:HAE1 family hydrophobic/amphiphilic exporter-1
MMKKESGILGRLSSLSVDKYRIVYLGVVMITIMGLSLYNRLPRESKPEIVFPTIKIMTNYPGASPRDVELLITNRLEAVLINLPELEFISSSSLAGRSEIQLDFYPESNLEENSDAVNQAVDLVLKDLPEEAETPTIRISTTANRAFLVLSLAGDVEPEKLREASLLLERRLQALEGVSELRLSGLNREEIRIEYSPAVLAEYGLAPDDILQAVKLNHKDTPAGEAELDGMLYYVRVLGALASIDQIRKTQIPLPGGSFRFLKDLATVERHSVPGSTLSRRAVGLGTENVKMLPSVTLSLYRDGGSDIVGPSQGVYELLEELGKTELLSRMDIQIIQDDAVTVKQDLSDVLENAFSGLLIVILVLYLFLGIREALITSLIIPFSMFISFAAMDMAGMTFNTMTLLAMIIALGLLVDNGIVIVESIVDHRKQNEPLVTAVKNAAGEVAPSIFAATLTTMAAFIPLALMEGRIGMIISIIPLTVIFIIGSSLLVALTLTPALSARWLHKTEKREEKQEEEDFPWGWKVSLSVIVSLLFGWAFFENGKPGFLSITMTLLMGLFMALRLYFNRREINAFDRVAGLYEKGLDRILNHRFYRGLLPGIMFALLGIVFWGLFSGFLKMELFPIKDETALYAVITAPEYSTLDNTDRITREVEEKLMLIDGIGSLYSEVGLTSNRDAQVVMNLLPPDERSWTTQKKIPELMGLLSSIPGARITVGTQAGGKTANSPVQIKIKGEDLDTLKAASETLSENLASVSGVRGVISDWEKGYPELQILPKTIYAAAAGVDSSMLGTQVRSYLGGQSVGTLLVQEGEMEILLDVNQNSRDSRDDLDRILITLKNGEVLPITHVTDMIQTQGYGTIRHSQGMRTVTVMAQMLPDANIREIVAGFEQIRSESPPLPGGISYAWAGEAADLNDSLGSMFYNFMAALVVVFLILAIQFDSFSQSLVIMLSVPMSIIGVFTGLILTGNNFGLYAFMGVIALVGIVVNDAIVLVDTVNRLRKEGAELLPALTRAGRSRFAPVLATSLTTIGGMLPLAFKDENFAQLSISLISGLLASTVLTLLILPLTFYSTYYLKQRVQKTIPVFIDLEEDK